MKKVNIDGHEIYQYIFRRDKIIDFKEISKIGDLSNGSMKKVNIDGHEILLARVGDKYYAIDRIVARIWAEIYRKGRSREQL
jgi:hypothetical protein